MKIGNIVSILLIILLLSFNIMFAQGPLPTIVDPLYTQPIADPLAIPKFVNPLPIVPRLDYTEGADETMYMGIGTHDFGLMPGTNLSTEVWGYNTIQQFGYLGPTIVAKDYVPVIIQWVNQLGNSYPLPEDITLHWAYSHAYSIANDGVPAVPHLHGGNTESASWMYLIKYVQAMKPRMFQL